MKKPFVHDDPDWPDLISIVSGARNVVPGLVEKDYWIMHVLWSLSEVGLHFYLKGGTSLST